MRLLLVDNLLYHDLGSGPEYILDPHAGLMSLVAVARGGGHQATVLDPKWELSRGRLRLDPSLYGALADMILRRSPEVVGFTALGCNFVLVMRLAAELKRRCRGLPILLGGPHASILHREILERFETFDVVVRNEAEETLLPLLDRLEDRRFADLPGISYRMPGGQVACNPGRSIIEDLDALPFPAYDAYPIAEMGHKVIPLEAGRGCPFNCVFCSTASFFGRRYRLKSAARLVSQMDELNRIYGFGKFSFTHDLFTVNRKKILEFCEAVRDRGYRWSCSARVDCVDPALLRAMAEAGCGDIYFGIETGSPRMQKISRKRLDLDLVDPILAQAAALGIGTTTSFIIGYPEEEAADQAATLDMAGQMRLRTAARSTTQLHMLTPEPGTALIVQHGGSMGYDGEPTDFNLPLLDAADIQTVQDNPDLFPNYRYYPTVLPRQRHVFAAAAFHALQETARPILRYLLCAYEGRMSLLIDAADAWRRSQGMPPSPIDPDFFAAFATARFGERHHMVSLLRYAAAIDRVRVAAKRYRERAAPPRRDAPLRLGRCSEILTDIHDALALLKRVEGRDTLLSDEEAGPRTALLVKADFATDEIASFTIDAATARMLRRFSAPKRYRAFRSEVLGDGADAPWTWSDVRELCANGVLEAAAD